MTSERPEVSVIIPTRNRWSLLASSAIPAALSQEDVDLEVIVVDDGSTDETHSRLARCADLRVRIFRHEFSRGVSAARNTGIEQARGEWLAFLDDDDIWAPRKLRAQVDAARAVGAGLAYSAAVVVDDERRVIGVQAAPEAQDLPHLLLRRNVVPGGCSNVVARGDLVRRLGGFDERLAVFGDWDLWLRLAQTTEVSRCSEIHVGYVQHQGNMMIRRQRPFFEELDYLAAKHRAAAPDGKAVDRLAAARSAAWSNHRAGHRLRAAGFYLRAGIECRSRPDIARAVLVLVRGLIPHAAIARALFRLHARVASVGKPGRRDQPETVLPRPQWIGGYLPAGRREVARKP